MKNIKVIGFDADDTLWVNEPYFREAEQTFACMLGEYAGREESFRSLYETEIRNISLYGYGIKGFTLSMIETALHISGNRIGADKLQDILRLGKNMLSLPVRLLDGVEETLRQLHDTGRFRLVLATKGDLTDQYRKIRESGLESYFHRIEIMSYKNEAEYAELIKTLDIQPDEFLMIGNSLRSDILPVAGLGGKCIHIPYEITWIHEESAAPVDYPGFHRIGSIGEVVKILA